MNEFLALEISSSGMRAQRIRMRTIAENLANQHTTGPHGPYQRKDTIFESQPLQTGFEDQLSSALQSARSQPAVVQQVQVSEVREDGSQPIRVYDPSHPHADENGYVLKPNISIFREMTDMIEASRSYEANLAASKSTKEMIKSALELLQ